MTLENKTKRNLVPLTCTVLIWRMSVRYARRKSRFMRASRGLIPKILNYSLRSIESNVRCQQQSTLHHFPNPVLMGIALASINHHYATEHRKSMIIENGEMQRKIVVDYLFFFDKNTFLQIQSCFT